MTRCNWRTLASCTWMANDRVRPSGEAVSPAADLILSRIYRISWRTITGRVHFSCCRATLQIESCAPQAYAEHTLNSKFIRMSVSQVTREEPKAPLYHSRSTYCS
jgi:hypothetical protein